MMGEVNSSMGLMLEQSAPLGASSSLLHASLRFCMYAIIYLMTLSDYVNNVSYVNDVSVYVYVDVLIVSSLHYLNGLSSHIKTHTRHCPLSRIHTNTYICTRMNTHRCPPLSTF